jgi:hypothetical protein
MAGKRKKDVKSWEQTEGRVENTRVSVFWSPKQSDFWVLRAAKHAKQTKKMAPKRRLDALPVPSKRSQECFRNAEAPGGALRAPELFENSRPAVRDRRYKTHTTL